MAKRRKRNKAQAIREYHEQHPEEGPTEVAAALKKMRLSVTPQQVSTTLSNARRKMRAGGRRRRKGATQTTRSQATRREAGVGAEHLKSAAELIRQCGGAEEAVQALRAAEEIAETVRG